MIARVKINEENGSQTLTIPPELAIPASEVFMSRHGGKLVIEPVMVSDKASFFDWLETIEPWDGPGPDIDDPLPEKVEL